MAAMAVFQYSMLNHFDAMKFYQENRNADFLKKKNNIQVILSKGNELRNRINGIHTGNYIKIAGLCVKDDELLRVYRSGLADESDITGDLFTARRLTGLVAAYVYANNNLFPEPPYLFATEPEALGLDYDTNNSYYADQNRIELQKFKRKLYFAAVPGAEYFVEQFEHYPLICGLKKFQRKEISVEELTVMAKIRLPTGERTATKCMSMVRPNRSGSASLPSNQRDIISFGRTFDLQEAIESAPEQVKCLFTVGANENY